MIGGCRLASSRQFLAQLPPLRSDPDHYQRAHTFWARTLGHATSCVTTLRRPNALGFTFGAQIKFGKLFTFLLTFFLSFLPKIKSGGFFLFSDSSTFPLKFLAAVGGRPAEP
uniref:(northern house mosquito) hypothetical protein n=1 Tax=Culex pipiens TaxID=7175 RepID=A0A8D8DHD5_CULPI